MRTTGNTSASAAAYAARASITCAVLIPPQGKIAMGKLAQAVMHGAKIIQIDGNFPTTVWNWPASSLPTTRTISLVNSVNPVRIEGTEDRGVVRDRRRLGCRPTFTRSPVGNAGNITAYWKGYTANTTATA